MVHLIYEYALCVAQPSWLSRVYDWKLKVTWSCRA